MNQKDTRFDRDPRELMIFRKPKFKLGGRDEFYIKSYPHLVGAAAVLDGNDPFNFTVLAHLAYGWMPTTLRIMDSERLGQFRSAPIRHMREVSAPQTLLEGCHSEAPVNNSWVGTSKCLHFANPNVFPIWDSKIARHFRMLHRHQYNRKKCYLAYCSFVSACTSETAVADMRQYIAQQWNYEITPVRAVELILFLSAPDRE